MTTREQLELEIVERVRACDVTELTLVAMALDELEAERAAAGEHDDFDFAEWDALDDEHGPNQPHAADGREGV